MYLAINNFKFGLDTRRSELSSLPGTLIQALDGHINQGGEFEKRKAFVRINGVVRPSGTYGLEVCTQGLVVFGSTATPGGMALGALVAGSTVYNFNAGLNYPGVYYQRLIHPSSLFGNGAPPAMTALLCSTSFGGNTWAAATFADGLSCAFWNGIPIPAFYNGQALTGVATNQGLASILRAMVSTITGFSVGPVTASGAGYYFDMWAGPGLQYGVVASIGTSNTGTGEIQTTNISAFLAGVTGASSTAAFTVVAGSFTGAGGVAGGISSIKVFNQVTSTWVEILGATVSFTAGQNTADFVDNVAAQMATYQSNLLITALANNATMNLTFDVSLGAIPNGSGIRITCVGDCCIDNTVYNFINSTLPNTSTVTNIYLTNQIQLATGNYSGGGTVVVAVTTGKYYWWSPGANDISINNNGTVITQAGYFIAGTTSVTLSGTASTVVTAAFVVYVDILNTTITAGTSLNAWVAAIATGVQTYCAANNLAFTANAMGPVLTVSRTFVDTTLPNGGQSIIIYTNGGSASIIIIDGSGVSNPSLVPISCVAYPNPCLVTIVGTTRTSTATVTVSVAGGTPLFNFAWSTLTAEASVTEPTGTTGFSITIPTSISGVQAALVVSFLSNPQYANQITVQSTIIGPWSGQSIYFTANINCAVSDARGLVAFCTVSLIFHN